MDLTKTSFGDLRNEATEIVRVTTTQHLYFVAFHTERGRRYVVVRGQEGSDREHVVIRDSDPRIGDRSMFDVPLAEWVGKVMEIATMRTSPIAQAEVEPPASGSLRAHLKMQIDPPLGMAASPRIVHGLGRGTNVGSAQPRPVNPAATSSLVDHAREAARAAEVARQVVVGDKQLPYPLRHVVYAENVVAFLRSMNRRESLYADIAHDPELRGRYLAALADIEDLTTVLRRRTSK
jgi:hypothetical protein